MKFPTLIGCILLGLAHLPSVALAGIDPLPLLIERALAAHPSVRAQEALVAASRSGVESARWQYYPTPSVSVQNASTSASDTSYQGDQRITVVGLSQPIYTWGRLSASLAKAQVQEQIALDPVPYNGGTTSLQALWMGVPVICKRGANFVSRMGASFMSAAGLPDWVAEDDAGYVRIACTMAQDRAALLALKRSLRQRLLGRPGWDVVAHTRAMETALIEMAN